MKGTYRKSILRTVKQTMSRFLAIFAIVALGVGFLAGLLATTPDMRYTADAYFDDTHLFDLRVAGTLGLTGEDMDAIRAVEGVAEVMPAYTADAMMVTPSGDTLVARMHSLPMEQIEEKEPEDYLNRLVVVQGRLPVKDNECVVEKGLYGGSSFEVGDTLTLSEDNKELDDTFTRRDFKVVGVVESGYYFSIERESATVGNGTVGLVLYTGEQNFALDVYTDAYISVAGAEGFNSLEDDYLDYVEETAERIEDISGRRCELRLAQVRADAEAELDDARQKYEDARAEADEKLADAKAQLDDGQAQVEDAESQLESAKKQIDSGESELAKNKEQLPDTLTDSQNQLAAAKAQLILAKAQYEAGLKEVATQEQALADAKTQLAAAKQLLNILGPLLDQAEAAIPALEAQIPVLQAAAQQAQAAADAASEAAQEARANSNISELEAAFNAAQAAIDAARGELTEEEWQAADPAAAAPLLAAREAARVPYLTEKARLDALDASAATAQAAAAEAVNQANSAQANLDNARAQLQSYQAQLAEAKRQIAENEPLIATGEQQLAAAKQQLAAAQAQITQGEAQIAMGETQLNLAPDIAKLKLDLAEEKLKSSKEQYEEGTQELEDAKKELESGQREYESQKADVEQQLADAKRQIEDGEQALAELTSAKWYVLDRQTNVSFASFYANVQKVEAIARVFPWFFFLVAALVALTTMTRMVEEERLQIGTLKALGFSKGAIMAKYVLYAMAASVAGSAFGLALGFTFLPSIIWNAYSMMYNFPPLVCQFNVPYAALASGTAILCTLAATLNACWSTLHEVPATLMLPKAPQAGKRILLERVGPIWRRMKFTHKVTARNLFRYKKRFFMTLVGIAGCTALLVTGFGLHDSISDIVYKQFGELFTYDLSINLKNEGDEAKNGLHSLLEDQNYVRDYMLVHQEKSTNEFDGDSFNTYLFVPENSAQLDQFVRLRQRRGGGAVPFSETGVVITEKMSERADLDIGDSVTLKNTDGDSGTFTVAGIVENYVENYVYLSADTYRAAFGTAPQFTTIVAHAADDSAEGRSALSEELLGLDGVSGVSMVSDLKDSFNNMLQKIDTIVVVLIVSAGLLAFVVLYNLTNINIAERVKEIATLKVLGFFDKEVSAYVYRENVMLSIMGTAVGLVMGVFLHMFVIYSVEVDAVMFGRTIKPLSYVVSAVLTMVFSALVNLVMNRKLKKISMVESMKAPE